jgi:hypothetical protein
MSNSGIADTACRPIDFGMDLRTLALQHLQDDVQN